LQSCACARCRVLVHGCAESLCLSAAQILRGGCVGCTRKPRSPLNDQWCSDVSQLICGVWWCRLRVRCVPIRSVRWGSLRGFHPALFRVRRVPAHLWSLAMSTACLVRPGLQRPPRVRWGSLSGSHRPRFVGLALRTFPCRQSFLVFPLGPYCRVLSPA
jgi:hypothetical protein